MPIQPKRDCSIIVYDLNTDDKNLALKTLLKITYAKFLANTKDLTKLILVNSSETKNRFSDDTCSNKQYKHIYECFSQDPEYYDPEKLLLFIENNETSISPGNLIDTLHVASDSLRNDYIGIDKIINLQLLFISDLKNFNSEIDEKKLSKIILNLTAVDTAVYFIGPVDDDLTLQKSTVLPIINNGNTVDEYMEKLPDFQQNTTLGRVQRICRQLKGNVRTLLCSYKLGVHLFYTYTKSRGTQPWNVPLTIGSCIEFSASTQRALKMGSTNNVKAKWQQTPQYKWMDAEDLTKEYTADDLLHGIERHGKFIEITDAKMFKTQTVRCLRILFFTKSENVPEYVMRGDGTYFCHNLSDTDLRQFQLLVDYLRTESLYIIARRVYNRDFAPKFVCLVPCKDVTAFYMVQLPYANEVKHEYVEQKPKFLIETKREVYDFLDSINVEHKGIEIMPNMMLNKNYEKLIDKTADLRLGREMHLKDTEIDLLSVLGKNEIDLDESILPKQENNEKKVEEEYNVDKDTDFDWD